MFFIALLAILSSCSHVKANEQKTLEMVSLVYRHGARSPTNFYPNDQYQEKDWPDGAGMLTQKGMNIEYDLGIFLKERYIVNSSFITQLYSHEDVYIQSSGIDRCLQSAETQLAGLFPPQGYQVWNTEIPWQPIPVHSTPPESDSILRSFHIDCPKREAIWKEIMEYPLFKKKMDESADLFDQLTKYTGMKINAGNVWIIADVLTSERTEGLKVPKWADDLWERLIDISDWTFLYKFYGGGEKLGRILGGPILTKITSKMIDFRQNDSSQQLPKMNIFSGHDTSLLALSSGLDIKIAVPVFGACLMIELYHSTTNGFLVEMFYRNDYSDDLTKLKLKNCNHSCPLERFIELTKNRFTKDHAKECGFKGTLYSLHNLKILITVLSGTTIILLTTVGCLCRKKSARSCDICNWGDMSKKDEKESLLGP